MAVSIPASKVFDFNQPRSGVNVYRIPRSMRRTSLKPQLCAMSVALLAQEETVPSLGITASTNLSGESVILGAAWP